MELGDVYDKLYIKHLNVKCCYIMFYCETKTNLLIIMFRN